MAKPIDDITILKLKPGQEEEKGPEEEILRDLTRETRTLFSAMQDELDNRDDFADGLSFLDLKNDTLLSYMIDVCNIVLRKVRGETIEGHPSVERCVEYRVILEKLRGIDQKLAYQLNKLITMPDDAEQEDHRVDVKNLDINIDHLETDNDDGDTSDQHESDNDDDDTSGNPETGDDDTSDRETPPERPQVKPGIYKPPKLRSVAYEEGGRRKNYDDFYRDEEEGEIVEKTRATLDEDRVRYEEENYTRLPEENPKKTKRKLKTKEYRKKGNKKFKKRR